LAAHETLNYEHVKILSIKINLTNAIRDKPFMTYIKSHMFRHRGSILRGSLKKGI